MFILVFFALPDDDFFLILQIYDFYYISLVFTFIVKLRFPNEEYL